MTNATDGGPLFIRNYQSSDWETVYDVCVRTGDRGGDAGLTLEVPRLVPDAFAGPYMYLEPDLCFVLDDGGHPVGYVMGTADSADFVESYNQHWLPRVEARYPERYAPPFANRDELFVWLLYWPERMVVPEVHEAYPSHLHIDILPAHQGQGWGRKLIETFMAAAGHAGASGVHVAVDPANERAHFFYPRVGFERLDVPSVGEDVIFYGRKTSAA